MYFYKHLLEEIVSYNVKLDVEIKNWKQLDIGSELKNQTQFMLYSDSDGKNLCLGCSLKIIK